MEKQNETKSKLGLVLEKKPIRYSLGLVILTALAGAGYFVLKPVYLELKDSSVVKKFQEKGVLHAYSDTFLSIFHKLDDLEKLDRTNEELSRKVAVLEKELESEESKNTQEEAKEVTAHLEERLKGEAGSELARVLESIDYKPPTHLLPHQQYTLALGYFRKQEYEQAAVLFSYLTELKEDSSYQRSEVYLMSGISWFKLKQYRLSSEYIKKTLKKSDDDTSIHRKAILWQAVLAQAQNNSNESQRILTSLVARYPHSEEVTWINQRSPASRDFHEGHPAKKEGEDEVNHKPASEPEAKVVPEEKAVTPEVKTAPKTEQKNADAVSATPEGEKQDEVNHE